MTAVEQTCAGLSAEVIQAAEAGLMRHGIVKVKLTRATHKSYIQTVDEETGKLHSILNIQGDQHKSLAGVCFEYICEHECTAQELKRWKQVRFLARQQKNK